MKSIYAAPALHTYGDINALTQAIGFEPVNDVLVVAGTVIPNTDGSVDFH